MGEGKWVPPPPPRRRLSAWVGPAFFALLVLSIASSFAYPYLPPARAERERVVAIGRAELDQIAQPLSDDTGGTYTSIDLWRGPYVWRIYVTGLSCQEIHDYYAETLAKAGWSQWKAPYMKYDSDLVATYRKHTLGVSLKLILWCSLGTYEIHVIQPSFWNGQDQPEARY